MSGKHLMYTSTMDIILTNSLTIIAGIVAGIACFKYADWLASNLAYWPLLNHAKDIDKPIAFKIVGVTLIIVTIIWQILLPLAVTGILHF